MDKDLNLLIATPSYGYMKTTYTTSLLRLYHWLTNNKFEGYKPAHVSYGAYEGSVIAQARDEFCNQLVKENSRFTHLLFIDEDMGFRPEAFVWMLSRDLPMVGCNYRMKVAPCNFTARKKDDSGWVETNKDSTGVEEVLFMGFGFHLIKREVVEAVEVPRFLGSFDYENKKYSTEDGPFMVKTARKGFFPHVDHDASKLVYHSGNYHYSWDDSIPAEKKYPIAERLP